jgi:disulfide bond formation protein DsbB
VDVDAVTLLFALLAVVAQVAVVAAVVAALGARRSPAVARWRAAAAEVVGPEALALAAVVATVATAGSLSLSEVAHLTPCRLCWYQRAAMYPLVPLLWWSWWRRSLHLRPLGLTLAVAGGAISTWHVAVERYPSLEGGLSCDPANPCSLVWVRHLGYLTIPGMALSGFALVATLLLVATPIRPRPVRPPATADTNTRHSLRGDAR